MLEIVILFQSWYIQLAYFFRPQSKPKRYSIKFCRRKTANTFDKMEQVNFGHFCFKKLPKQLSDY